VFGARPSRVLDQRRTRRETRIDNAEEALMQETN
jgi:hypothetical protein